MLGMPMYMIKQITPKAREWKGTQTKLRYFKSLGSLNQFKHIMIRKGETRVGKVPAEQASTTGILVYVVFYILFLSPYGGVVMGTKAKESRKQLGRWMVCR